VTYIKVGALQSPTPPHPPFSSSLTLDGLTLLALKAAINVDLSTQRISTAFPSLVGKEEEKAREKRMRNKKKRQGRKEEKEEGRRRKRAGWRMREIERDIETTFRLFHFFVRRKQ